MLFEPKEITNRWHWAVYFVFWGAGLVGIFLLMLELVGQVCHLPWLYSKNVDDTMIFFDAICAVGLAADVVFSFAEWRR